MEVSNKVERLRNGLYGGDVFDAHCPSRVLLDHVTSRWGVLILVALSGRTMRWGELHRWVGGISEKMLAQTLRTLEADGLVHRDARAVVPPHVDYSLTDTGREVADLLLPLMTWISSHASDIISESGSAGAGAGARVGATA
ncbi:MAG: winged helix-turn-helix transcriptional regulator [Actinocrinis sp.]